MRNEKMFHNLIGDYSERQSINMKLPSYHNLDTMHLQRLFDNMSECYKLFWFKAIIDSVAAGKTLLRYEDLIDNMIADAWYMVTEYKLNLGPKDNLEFAVLEAYKISGLKSNEKRDVVIETIKKLNDKNLKKKKLVLTYNVPYRLQAPFLSFESGKSWDGPKLKLAERINAHDGLVYNFRDINGLNSLIEVDEVWAKYIQKNYEIISGWIQYNMIIYLQRRNPNVPGISSKLFPPQERNLAKVNKLWKAILEVAPIHEIYKGIEMTSKDFSIDHFVPWSYVAHDELWNLSPTTRSINSSKSNNLPDWETYFPMLQELEYTAYITAYDFPKIQKLYNDCLKEHVNSEDIRYKLYRPSIPREEFYFNLEGIVRPVYEAARNMGFNSWRL